MTKEKIFRYLEKKYEEGKNSSYVNKPWSWAIYQTWKYADCHECRRQDRVDSRFKSYCARMECNRCIFSQQRNGLGKPCTKLTDEEKAKIFEQIPNYEWEGDL